MIDMAVPSDRNTSVTVMEKLSKYRDLELEITRMWNTGTLGVIQKGLEKCVDRTSGKTRSKCKKS